MKQDESSLLHSTTERRSHPLLRIKMNNSMTKNSLLAKKPTVLVVDDTPDNLFFLGHLLGDSYQVQVANNGNTAIEIAQSDEPPDLILLDIIMPDMDGYAVCKVLKKNNATRRIPVIFLTGKSEIGNEIYGLNLGAADYITRPINPAIFLSRIKVHIQVKAMQDSLRDQRTWFHSIIESAPDAMLVTDDEGEIVLCNSRAAQIFGYGSSELYFRNLSDLIDEDKGIRKDNSEFAAEVSFNHLPNLNESGSCICVLVRDITERKRVEDDIRAAKELAEEASRLKSDFLANVSHELRTPLNAIIGYSEILQEDAAEIGHPEFVDDLNKIHRAGKQLLHLINDILDLSKIESGKMDIFVEEIDLRLMLEDIKTMMFLIMTKNNNQFVIETRDLLFKTMTVDVTKLKQILFNLLSNAAKFTSNGTITLTAKNYLHGEEERVIFSVSDTGIGLTPEQIKKLFRPFVQADASTTRKYGGTGLGLVISRRYCEMMGSELCVSSEINQGSTFTVDLPMVVVQNN
jgi:signal transduction histidine kinase